MSNEEIFQKLQEMIADQFTVDCEEVQMSTSFENDLGADSVDLVELVMGIEDEFDVGEIDENDLSGLKTVGDCVQYLSGRLK